MIVVAITQLGGDIMDGLKRTTGPSQEGRDMVVKEKERKKKEESVVPKAEGER